MKPLGKKSAVFHTHILHRAKTQSEKEQPHFKILEKQIFLEDTFL